MNEKMNKRYRRGAKMVEKRVGVGPTEIVAGWQNYVTDLLHRAQPFMKAGSIVTFQQLDEAEVVFFERLHVDVQVPASVRALFLPPSVREQMMGEGSSDSGNIGQMDAGVVLACPLNHFDICLNALFAHPPFTPAVDVYDQGQMVAGYQYENLDECVNDLTTLLVRHLGSGE
jgi:hypothetical protein